MYIVICRHWGVGEGGGGADAPNRLFMKGVGLCPSPHQIYSVYNLPYLNIMPQQLITCLFIHFNLKLIMSSSEKIVSIDWNQAIVITVEAYISLPVLSCLEAWTPLGQLFPDLTLSCILYGSVGLYFQLLFFAEHSETFWFSFITFKIYC